jgi:Phage protein (N4 Gp49/phage Sf6 gene 66) family
MARDRFSECGATDDEVLESLQEELDGMQKTSRQHTARVRDFEVAALALRTMFRQYQKRKYSDAQVLLAALEPLFKLLEPAAKPKVERSNQRRRTMTTDAAIEQEIQDKGLTAPRVTPASIEATITNEFYFVGGDGVYGNARKNGDEGVQAFPQSLDLLTICILVLANGFTVTGESACASPENFDAAIGRKIARANAVAKIWPLEGYLLKSKLAG